MMTTKPKEEFDVDKLTKVRIIADNYFFNIRH